jgi:hypothetical protein
MQYNIVGSCRAGRFKESSAHIVGSHVSLHRIHPRLSMITKVQLSATLKRFEYV